MKFKDKFHQLENWTLDIKVIIYLLLLYEAILLIFEIGVYY